MKPLLAAAVVALVVACGDGVPKPETMLPASEEQARAIASDFIDALSACDDDRLAAVVDSKNLARRAMEKAKVSARIKKSMLAELDRSDFNAGKKLCKGLAEDAIIDLVRIRQLGAEHRPLLRVVGNGAFNYYDVFVGVSKRTGRVVIVDTLDFYGGEHLSDIVAASAGLSVEVAQRGENVSNIQELTAATQNEDWPRVRELIKELPAPVRESRGFRLAELQALMKLGESEYITVVDEFERDFPDDPALLMLRMDQDFMKKDVRAALATLDRLDRKVGGDPYLDTHRASAYLLDPTPANQVEADRLARASVVAVPQILESWWTLVTIQVMRGDHAGVATSLDEIQLRFDYEFDRDDMAADEFYGTFRASPEFEAWWARQEPAP